MNERATEDRILDAAHAVFLKRGTAGARTQEIADEAGVNKALLHYYFRSKDQLAQAVFRRALQALLPKALEILHSDVDLEAKVRGIVDLEIDILRANPFLPGYLLGELTHHPDRVQALWESVVGMKLGRMGQEVRTILQSQLDAAADSGRMRRISPEHFLMNLISMVIFPFAAQPLLHLVLDVDAEGFETLMEVRREHIPDFFLNAMRP
ncbi:MAG: helix-turn-helix domain-containing protein [Longimicrobiales bacterium]|nr:helix-turn-helix domain-containing protein [Longimicrobiales bacterium]